jgi:HEPN domain-containing protein
MPQSEIIKEWLNRADEDFQFASSNLEDRDKFFGQICFHFHQSAEKHFKAFIVANELKFEKIHDLRKLLNTCLRREPTLSYLREECEFLNPFYIETRYPVHWPTHYTREEASKAKTSAQKIAEKINMLLK